MRKVLTVIVGMGLLWSVPMLVQAEDAKTTEKPAAEKAKADTPTPAQLRVKLHRTMAALIEAQAAEDPDAEKIEKLTNRLQTLRAKIWAAGPAGPQAGFGPGQGRWGGPRMARQGGGYGPGRGYGRGRRGWGGGPGYGQGYGRGWGRGYGRLPCDPGTADTQQ